MRRIILESVTSESFADSSVPSCTYHRIGDTQLSQGLFPHHSLTLFVMTSYFHTNTPLLRLQKTVKTNNSKFSQDWWINRCQGKQTQALTYGLPCQHSSLVHPRVRSGVALRWQDVSILHLFSLYRMRSWYSKAL